MLQKHCAGNSDICVKHICELLYFYKTHFQINMLVKGKVDHIPATLVLCIELAGVSYSE